MSDYRKNGTMKKRAAQEYAEACCIMEENGTLHDVRTDLVPIYVRALAELWRQNHQLRAASPPGDQRTPRVTDRVNGLTVVLDRDYRDDDVETVVAAIRQLRGVASVEPVIVTADAAIAELRARWDCQRRLFEFAKSLDRVRPPASQP